MDIGIVQFVLMIMHRKKQAQRKALRQNQNPKRSETTHTKSYHSVIND